MPLPTLAHCCFFLFVFFKPRTVFSLNATKTSVSRGGGVQQLNRTDNPTIRPTLCIDWPCVLNNTSSTSVLSFYFCHFSVCTFKCSAMNALEERLPKWVCHNFYISLCPKAGGGFEGRLFYTPLNVAFQKSIFTFRYGWMTVCVN